MIKLIDATVEVDVSVEELKKMHENNSELLRMVFAQFWVYEIVFYETSIGVCINLEKIKIETALEYLNEVFL